MCVHRGVMIFTNYNNHTYIIVRFVLLVHIVPHSISKKATYIAADGGPVLHMKNAINEF